MLTDFIKLLKIFKLRKEYVIDNLIYRLNFKATLLLLIGLSVIVISKQFFGDPIDCLPVGNVPNALLDTYCWVHATFSVESGWNKRVGVEVPYPGVTLATDEDKIVHHYYYQWVYLVLLLQGLFFYGPHFLWKSIENMLIQNLVANFSTTESILNQNNQNSAKLDLLVNYLTQNLSMHNYHYFVYILTEILNLLNVVAQIYLIDLFLGGEFASFGWNVINFTDWGWSLRLDPMLKVFPRMAKCKFHFFGTGGGLNAQDTMCLLPLNIVNEKVYIFLWFWFHFLLILNSCAVIYRFLVLLTPEIEIVIMSKFRKLEGIRTVRQNVCAGDWFLIGLIEKNLNTSTFRKLIEKLSNKLDKGDNKNENAHLCPTSTTTKDQNRLNK